MLLSIHPKNPDARKVAQVVNTLKQGGIIIYPTDSVYAYGCDIFNQEAVERICKLRGLDPSKAMLSIICKDISQVASFAHQLDNDVFRLLKDNVPGAFTFILKAGSKTPKIFHNRKKTIGVRIPDQPIALSMVEGLGNPILTASLRSTNDTSDDYENDPGLLYEQYGSQVDIFIEGGVGGLTPSTVIDCTGDAPVVLREGAGELA
jgi:tRNA threonylcarbamoyl adenosine modification protein (Sua5/YciO/YrdC/YwlC family)